MRAQGTKLGDLQATLMGMASTALFFAISLAQLLSRLPLCLLELRHLLNAQRARRA